ncbi:MAG: response regulator [candidate division WS1 bacterium]|nr:response regulator [candidate division WS1 bacterium]
MVSRRILAVDDNPLMLDVYEAVFGKAGYEVTTASDGLQALQRLEQDTQSPDLVLLDIHMPRMTGWELLETMRGRVEWQDVPVIMVSALVEPSAAEQDSLPVFQCYATKQTTGAELVALAEQVLDGTYSQQPECRRRRAASG